ncbi:helix-turn-helix transcriptional regulator [Rhizobium sp. P44RR-XXIV]|uniref:helix-turn-helix domain-containing protein n=1 Tax=Rhizobium sp. P44RR-XXIV TaxID=1921145 RepID=UPI00248492C6|nr:helix-turn-helix transcriptional regulator [Rhizobium sp. P44RR-XXIV]
MARAAAGLGVRELAELAGVTANTVTRIENGADAKQSTLDALQAVLEKHVIFLSDGETTSGGPGVRLRTSSSSIDTIESEMVQYPENIENDAPPGAGG